MSSEPLLLARARAAPFLASVLLVAVLVVSSASRSEAAVAVPPPPPLSASLTSSSRSGLNASVVDGVFYAPDGSTTSVNGTFSLLNAAIRSVWSSFSPPPLNATLVNASSGLLSFLVLDGGAWVADEPLDLSYAQLLLVLRGGFVAAPSGAFDPSRGLVEINGSAYGGVLAPGGPEDARFVCADAAVSPAAVWAVDSPYVSVDGLSIFGCGQTSGGGVHLQGRIGAWAPTVAGGLIANCNITNSSRAVWLETIAGVVVQGNTLWGNGGHALDFDAFSTACVATNNTIWGNAGREGVFIEQGAAHITVAGNTIGPGNGNGVAVYNNDMNVTCGPHVIVDNDIFGNVNAGIAVGSTAPRAGTPDVGVIIAGNRLHGNGAAAGKLQGYHTNGAQIGTVYAANANADGVSKFTQTMAGVANISIFDPLNRERALGY